MNIMNMRNQTYFCLTMLAFFLLCLLLAITLGASDLTPIELLQGLWNEPATDRTAFARTVLLSLRLPRAITAALAGGALAAAGVLTQGLFRNALASPSVLGTEAVGSLAAVIVFYLSDAYAHWLTLPLAAFGGAMLATAAIFRLASEQRLRSLASLLLVGFAINAFAGALTSLVLALTLEDYQKTAAVMHWLLGGFAAKGWEHVAMIAPLTGLGLACAWRLTAKLDVLSLGAEVAASLSVDMRSLRRWALVGASLLVGGAIVVAGSVPFVGLVVPHVTRLALGPKHKRLLLFSFVNGMSLTLVADLLARTLRAPSEIEAGIFTALLGAPFFLVLLLTRRNAGGEAS